MTGLSALLLAAVVIGAGGAAAMDLWGLVARRVFGIQGLDYALLGRWIGHMAGGQFAHRVIASATPVRGERLLGWAAHYSIGIAFGALLIAVWGADWVEAPTIGPAMIVGLGTIAAPWLVMQPAMGMGIAAARAANPMRARLRNLATHASYGLGLYLSAVALSTAWS